VSRVSPKCGALGEKTSCKFSKVSPVVSRCARASTILRYKSLASSHAIILLTWLMLTQGLWNGSVAVSAMLPPSS